jgi:formiminoglutamase
MRRWSWPSPHRHGHSDDVAPAFRSPWLARKDADWWIDRLYDFATLGATTIRTAISRSVIDVNRDPSGASLYPGKATTALCPVDTFDGEPLYVPGAEPDAAEIARPRMLFRPYHAAIRRDRALRQVHTGRAL